MKSFDLVIEFLKRNFIAFTLFRKKNIKIHDVNVYDLPLKILEGNFISPEDIMRRIPEVKYTEEQLAMFKNTLPDMEELELCHNDNYILFPGPNVEMSVMDIYKNFGDCYQYLGHIYDNLYIYGLKDRVSPKWYKIKIEYDFDSKKFVKNFGEQQESLSEMEKMPNLPELTWFLFSYQAVKGVNTYHQGWIRTSTLGYNGGENGHKRSHFCTYVGSGYDDFIYFLSINVVPDTTTEFYHFATSRK